MPAAPATGAGTPAGAEIGGAGNDGGVGNVGGEKGKEEGG